MGSCEGYGKLWNPWKVLLIGIANWWCAIDMMNDQRYTTVGNSIGLLKGWTVGA